MSTQALTHEQKLQALAHRFYQGSAWQPKVGDYYTTSRADLELYRVMKVEGGKIYTEYCTRPGELTEWDADTFTTHGFGPRRVHVPDFILASTIAQTEQQPAYVECRECTDCGHVGINDAHQTDATCAMCDWSGPSPVEDQCPDCGKENVMGAACPKCSGRYRILAEAHVAAPIAQTATQPEQSGLVEALEAIVRQYPNPDISHVDYRVHACRQAEQALDAYRAALSAQGAGDADS